jgi:ArsR family transcriptional regulator
MSTVSKHLSVLRQVGLVEADKRGKQVFYALRLTCTLGFIHCVDNALQEREG